MAASASPNLRKSQQDVSLSNLITTLNTKYFSEQLMVDNVLFKLSGKGLAENLLNSIHKYMYKWKQVSRQLPQWKLPPPPSSPQLGLALKLGFGIRGEIFLGGNCPRTVETVVEMMSNWYLIDLDWQDQ